ncbi:MAG: DUF2726 domain-containing protein [Clostridia bacterium]|nr:DUF2726 domain-containing protein [Clostridia bacterium]
MKCCVCGAESGKYPLCKACNRKRETGQIVKCQKCNQWHYITQPCAVPKSNPNEYLYELKTRLISNSEQSFYCAIKQSVPDGFQVFPQINLATFIERTDNARWHNELFRNIDFLITDTEYRPKIAVEINDQTHYNSDRKERDEKVKNICEEAGIPILKLWTSYGANQDYIKRRIDEILSAPASPRIHHFNVTSNDLPTPIPTPPPMQPKVQKSGCYIATCVYGSYDCPEVWTLRRYRDFYLSEHFWGRFFIRSYYAVSPTLVDLFGKRKWFHRIWRKILNRKIQKLYLKGYSNQPYSDK